MVEEASPKLTVHDCAPHVDVVFVEIPHQDICISGSDLPMKGLPQAPDAFLQLGWKGRGLGGSQRGAWNSARPFPPFQPLQALNLTLNPSIYFPDFPHHP